MQEQFDIQISCVGLKEVGIAPFINKLITEGLKIVDSTYYEIQKIKEETNVHRL